MHRKQPWRGDDGPTMMRGGGAGGIVGDDERGQGAAIDHGRRAKSCSGEGGKGCDHAPRATMEEGDGPTMIEGTEA